jgi:hypothetical protein
MAGKHVEFLTVSVYLQLFELLQDREEFHLGYTECIETQEWISHIERRKKGYDNMGLEMYSYGVVGACTSIY